MAKSKWWVGGGGNWLCVVQVQEQEGMGSWEEGGGNWLYSGVWCGRGGEVEERGGGGGVCGAGAGGDGELG